MGCPSRTRTAGSKTRTRPARDAGLKSREALRAHVSITFPDETASADAFENSWLSRPMIPRKGPGTGISSASVSQTRSSRAFT